MTCRTLQRNYGTHCKRVSSKAANEDCITSLLEDMAGEIASPRVMLMASVSVLAVVGALYLFFAKEPSKSKKPASNKGATVHVVTAKSADKDKPANQPATQHTAVQEQPLTTAVLQTEKTTEAEEEAALIQTQATPIVDAATTVDADESSAPSSHLTPPLVKRTLPTTPSLRQSPELLASLPREELRR
jgi:hypothetical protein